MDFIHDLRVKVTPEGITPSGPLAAGVQGDHNATRITFSLSDSLVHERFRYRLEYEDGTGFCDSTDFMELSGTSLFCFLPLAWTQGGGIGLLRLVVSLPGQNGDEQTIYSEAVRLRFSPRCDVEKTMEKGQPFFSSLLENSKKILEKAKNMATRVSGSMVLRHMAMLDETGNLADSGIVLEQLVTTDDMAIYTPRASGFDDEGKRVYGLVSTAGPKEFLGVSIEDGNVRLYPATEPQIAAQFEVGEDEDYGFDTPITPRTVNYAVKTALTKNYLAWTEEEQAAARALIGIDDSAPAPSFKPYKTQAEIHTDAALIGDGFLYVLWVGSEQLFDYDSTTMCFLAPGALLKCTITEGTVKNALILGNTQPGVGELKKKIGDVEAALDAILAMQEALIGGAV